MEPDPVLVDIATEEWRIAFNEGAHTSFHMIEAIRQGLQLDYSQILTNPVSLRGNGGDWILNEDELDDPSNRFYYTWASRTGRCTSFAIKVAKRLERNNPNTFHFEFFNLGRHRLARCDLTGIVIDSESDYGALWCPPGEDFTPCEGPRGRWSHHHGTSIYEDRSAATVRMIRPISATEALNMCLREVAENANLLCGFR